MEFCQSEVHFKVISVKMLWLPYSLSCSALDGVLTLLLHVSKHNNYYASWSSILMWGISFDANVVTVVSHVLFIKCVVEDLEEGEKNSFAASFLDGILHV